MLLSCMAVAWRKGALGWQGKCVLARCAVWVMFQLYTISAERQPCFQPDKVYSMEADHFAGSTGVLMFAAAVASSCRALLSRYPEALVVPDLTQDVRFKDSPIVTDWPRARFYAACPLVAHTGSRLGTL